MSPAQVRALAAACGTVQPRDAAIVARATHSAVPAKFFLDGEDRRRPLKGRGVHSQRSIPVPDELVGVLRRHLDQWAQPEPGGLVFTNTQSGRIDLSNVHRDVWTRARDATSPPLSPLRQVRLHDLWHAAITTWSTPESPSRPPRHGAATRPCPSS